MPVLFLIRCPEQCLAQSRCSINVCNENSVIAFGDGNWSEREEGDLLSTVNSCTLGVLYHVHLSPIQKMNKIKTKQNKIQGLQMSHLGCVLHTPEKVF